MPSIELKGIYKSFPKTGKVLSNVNLQTEENELLVILGPSGCGKSTLLKIIAGLEKASSGQVLIDNISIDNYTPSERNVGMVFQTYSLYPHLSAYENIAFPLRLRKVNRKEIKKTVTEIADLLDIRDCLERKPAKLSGGQRQRVAIGRAIAREPKIYLFDEPLSNLDAALREKMRAELVRIHNTINSVFVYVTHDQIEAMAIGDRVAVLNKGEIQQIDSPQNVYNKPYNTFVAGFIGTPKMNFITKPLAEILGCTYEANTNAQMIYGIRPEHIIISGREVCSPHGIIRMIELLGRDVCFHVEIMEQEITICCNSIELSALKIGDSISLSTVLDSWHIFDSASGKRCV